MIYTASSSTDKRADLIVLKELGSSSRLTSMYGGQLNISKPKNQGAYQDCIWESFGSPATNLGPRDSTNYNSTDNLTMPC